MALAHGCKVNSRERHSLCEQSPPSAIPRSPQEARLDRVPNPHPDTDYVARFTAPEFTSLCPVTGQPDFAILVIDYVPGPWLVESKSLKLYLNGFRDHGAFHEDCTVAIGKRLAELLEPRYLLHIGGCGIPAAASRSTCSGRPAKRRRTCGCPTRAWRPTGRAERGPSGRKRRSGRRRGSGARRAPWSAADRPGAGPSDQHHAERLPDEERKGVDRDRGGATLRGELGDLRLE